MEVMVANIGIFIQIILKKVLNFLVAKQQPKSGSLSKFQVVYGLPGQC